MRVLIVGAGIAGLSAAHVFESFGHDVTIVERSETLVAEGAGLCLPANSIKCLDQLGYLDNVFCTAFQTQQWQFLDDAGEVICQIQPEDYFSEDVCFAAISRPVFQDILRSKLRNVDLKCGTTVRNFSEVDGLVEVELSDGTNTQFDFLIGADGIHSKLRTSLQPEVELVESGVWAWRFLTPRPSGIDNPKYYLGNGSFVLLQPVSAAEMYVGVVGVPQSDPRLLEDDNKAELKRILKTFSGLDTLLPDIGLLEQLHIAPIKSLSKIAWGKGRVLLIGDAAHACPPALQQGASQALEDVLCLKQLLQKEHDILKLRQTFELMRSERVEWVAQNSYQSIKQLCCHLTKQALAERNKMIQDQGPNNFVLWQTLFSRDNLF